MSFVQSNGEHHGIMHWIIFSQNIAITECTQCQRGEKYDYISESSQTDVNTTATDSAQPPHSQSLPHKNRLSASFKAIFTNKAISADGVRLKKMKKKGRCGARSRGSRRSGNNRILDIFTKHKKKRKEFI
eukprot:1122855_1